MRRPGDYDAVTRRGIPEDPRRRSTFSPGWICTNPGANWKSCTLMKPLAATDGRQRERQDQARGQRPAGSRGLCLPPPAARPGAARPTRSFRRSRTAPSRSCSSRRLRSCGPPWPLDQVARVVAHEHQQPAVGDGGGGVGQGPSSDPQPGGEGSTITRSNAPGHHPAGSARYGGEGCRVTRRSRGPRGRPRQAAPRRPRRQPRTRRS